MNLDELNVRLKQLGPYPKVGTVDLIACRPENGERTILQSANLTIDGGMEGDNWISRGSRHTTDGGPHRGMQIAIMSSKIISLLTDSKERWAEAGDQFFVNYDLSQDNLNIGDNLKIGNAILEVSDMPHTSCVKFTKRYGKIATKFVSQPDFSRLRLRGINTRIVKSGVVKLGDSISKVREINKND